MTPVYSSSLNAVKGLELETTGAPECGLILGVGGAVEDIAKRLVATRMALGLSQAELCRRTGIAANTYNQWEQANGRPGLDGALVLCRTFGITLDWIYLADMAGLPHKLAVDISAVLNSRSAAE